MAQERPDVAYALLAVDFLPAAMLRGSLRAIGSQVRSTMRGGNRCCELRLMGSGQYEDRELMYLLRVPGWCAQAAAGGRAAMGCCVHSLGNTRLALRQMMQVLMTHCWQGRTAPESGGKLRYAAESVCCSAGNSHREGHGGETTASGFGRQYLGGGRPRRAGQHRGALAGRRLRCAGAGAAQPQRPHQQGPASRWAHTRFAVRLPCPTDPIDSRESNRTLACR